MTIDSLDLSLCGSQPVDINQSFQHSSWESLRFLKSILRISNEGQMREDSINP